MASIRQNAPGEVIVKESDIAKSTDEEKPSTPEERPVAHPLLFNKTGAEVLVDFDGPDDPYRPMNWPFRKKVVTTCLFGLTTCTVMFTSTIYSAAIRKVMLEFDVDGTTSAAGIAMMMFGFALGPMLYGPLSEAYGRKWTILIPYFLTAVFTFGSAASKDIQTLLITRFFAGFFGSAPLTNTGGALVDIWPPKWLGNAIVTYSMCLVVGPLLGPIVGGAIVQSYLGWRWTEYLAGILLVALWVVDMLVIDETYPPTLLVYKARRLRLKGGNWALHAKHEEWDMSLKDVATKYLIRPFLMLGTPICFLMCLYAAFVYGILYANLEGFNIEYEQIRGWGPVTGKLPFFALLVGVLAAAGLNVYNNGYYASRLRANHGKPVPEARLPPMMFGGIAFAVGSFIFAWTSDKDINYWPSLVGIALTGFGPTTIFQGSINYLIDTFTMYSASAVAANTAMRCIFAASFPLFINPMFNNLGVDWGTTIFAIIAAVLIPVPFAFFFWGQKIRARSKWSKHTAV